MKILIVEDQSQMGAYLKQGLAEAGFVTDLAATGTDGLHCALTGEYDLLILDVMLPELDGFSLLQSARRGGVDAPVLFLTARDKVEDRVKGLEIGADDYLVKPFAMAELLARVRALLRRCEQVTPPVLIAGSLTLDPVSRIVRQGCRPVALTQREFALLACLMRRPGVVFTRSMIAERIWDYQFDQASNVIDVYVAQLRRKIDLPNRPSFIQTVRGAGYVLLDPDVASA